MEDTAVGDVIVNDTIPNCASFHRRMWYGQKLDQDQTAIRWTKFGDLRVVQWRYRRRDVCGSRVKMCEANNLRLKTGPKEQQGINEG